MILSPGGYTGFACCRKSKSHVPHYLCISRNFITVPGFKYATDFLQPRVFRGGFSAKRGNDALYFILYAFQPVSSSDDVLAGSDKALRATLSTLSRRLLLLSDQQILDPVTISQTADAIARTGQALAVINTLRRSQE